MKIVIKVYIKQKGKEHFKVAKTFIKIGMKKGGQEGKREIVIEWGRDRDRRRERERKKKEAKGNVEESSFEDQR